MPEAPIRREDFYLDGDILRHRPTDAEFHPNRDKGSVEAENWGTAEMPDHDGSTYDTRKMMSVAHDILFGTPIKIHW